MTILARIGNSVPGENLFGFNSLDLAGFYDQAAGLDIINRHPSLIPARPNKLQRQTLRMLNQAVVPECPPGQTFFIQVGNLMQTFGSGQDPCPGGKNYFPANPGCGPNRKDRSK